MMDVDVDQPQHAPGSLDLVGGPFAVIESDPGVFTTLTRRLGINGLELVEMYDIEPWAVDHLKPHGLIFCFMWHKDTHRPADFDDPAAERVWFANQLSDDACATHAILNVLMNCPQIDLGDALRSFRADTEAMSPVLRGLAIANSPAIRPAHNYLARPCDLRASLNQIATITVDTENRKTKQKKASEKEAKPPPGKKAKTTKSKISKTKAQEVEDDDDDDNQQTYHFIGYVPAHGKVWELDGLKSGPLEVGELSGEDPASTQGWMDVVRPALRMKMEKYGGSVNDGSNIQFSLLAIVDDLYQQASDELEFLRRDKTALEKRMSLGWENIVDPTIHQAASSAFILEHQGSDLGQPGKVFAKDFASRRLDRDRDILQMPLDALVAAWQVCVQEAMRAKIALEDEYTKAVRFRTEHVKRTFDYEPFIKEYLVRLHEKGLLNSLLDRDEYGRKKPMKK